MENYKREFIQFLQKAGVLKFGDFTAKSGRKIPYFINAGEIKTGENIENEPRGNAWVLTVTKDSTGKYYIRNWVPLNDSTMKTYVLYNIPTAGASEIHGVSLNAASGVKKHIGTYAFNGNYYYFTTDGNLHYTNFDTTTASFTVNTVTAFKPTQAETQNQLYNLLLAEPYSFDCAQVSGVLRLTGFAPYKNGKLILNPQKGQSYDYKLYYTYPDETAKYCFHIEWQTYGTDSWKPVARVETEAYGVGPNPIEFKGISVDSDLAQFRIYAIKEPTDESLKKDYFNEAEQFTTLALANSVVLTASFNYYVPSQTDSTLNLGLARYNLATAKGMTYWKNRLWLFGAQEQDENGAIIKQDNTILFASEPNRPDWFPYTAGADIFEEDIICLQPMLEELLVFTRHNLYSLALSEDGLGWTKKHLQSNLNIQSWDLHLIQVVKNMVFFKSGNYYYMVVPKLTAASGAGLAIAPISKNIVGFLDDFETNVKALVDDLFNYSCYSRYKEQSKVTYDLKLVHYYNSLDYEDIHNNYVFAVEKKVKVGYDTSKDGLITETQKVYLTLSLLYNTVNRTWRIYTFESEQLIVPLLKDATNKGLYGSILITNGSVGLQFLSYSSDNTDKYIKQAEPKGPEDATVFKNWQYYDSGNLDQNSDMKKRFREYQFKVNNISKSFIEFYSGFYLDKNTRTYEIAYTQEVLTDDVNKESTVVIDSIPYHATQENPLSENISEEALDKLKYKYTKFGTWKLGTSQFPNTKNYKIRIPTSGKGYLPRMILISYNDKNYELLSCATVYRQLYSR